jgi:phosphatidylglycerol:prolipoprotein diacylglycerol transferase
MLPAINIPTKELFGLIPLQVFGILVTIAVVMGYFLGKRRAARVGLDPEILGDGAVVTIAAGFVVAHLVSVVFYFPERVRDNPLQLLAIWNGLSSFGGLFGSMLGAYIFYRVKGVSIIKYVDASIFGFVPAWIVGRLACTISFDHPGLPTDFVLGMSDKTGMPLGFVGLYTGGVVRHNLGFYEMLVAIVLTVVLYALGNVRPFDGFHPALMLALYAPVRFLMDFLRVGEKTYFGFSPGQAFALVMLAVAGILVYRGLKYHRAVAQAASPPEP